MLSITGVRVLPAYLFSCLYLWKICEDEQVHGVSRWSARLTGVLGSIYAVWLIYAAGLNYMLMAVIFIAAGLPVYLWAKSNKAQMSFAEKVLASTLVAVALFAIYAFARGIIKA